jgi:hypothetical protein
VDRLLDAPPGDPRRRDALEAQVAGLGEAGLDALDRAARSASPQRAWLAEAYAVRARVPAPTGGDFRGPSPNRSRRASADQVVALLSGADASAATAPALRLAASGEERALPWLEWCCDDVSVRPLDRFWCAEALVRARRPRAFARLERVLDALPDAPGVPQLVPDLVQAAVDAGDPETLPLLLRLRAGKERRFGSWARTVGPWIERLLAVPGGREAHDEALEPVRRFEAEAPPLLHSTGSLVEGGWQARRGRDRVEHMVYGPYANDLPREPLVARFRFRIDDDRTASEEPCLVLEVTSPQGERIGWPVRRAEVRRAGTPAGVFVERDVWFDPYEEGSQVELRVRFTGHADTTVDRVDVLRVRERRASDRAAAPSPAPRPYPPRAS